jgi:hypothetical protein
MITSRISGNSNKRIHGMSNYIEKIRLFLADMGWCNTSLYGINYLLHHITPKATLYKYALVAQPVRKESLLPVRRNLSIRVHQVNETEYDPGWFPRPSEVIRTRYSQGAVCLVAFKNDSAIGCMWLVLGPYLEDEVRCCFIPYPAGLTAWDFDVYLHPSYRTSLAFAYLWDAANAWLHERGIQWTMSRINVFNLNSIRTYKRLGAQQVGITLFVCFGIYQLLLTDTRPYLHVSCSDNIPKIIVRSPQLK